MSQSVFHLLVAILVVATVPGAGNAASATQSAIKVDNFQVAPEEDGSVGIYLRGALEETPFSLSGSVGSLVNAFDPELKCPVDLQLMAFGIKIKVRGTIMDFQRMRGIDASVFIEGQDVTGLEEFLGATIPIDGPFSLKAEVDDPEERSYRFSGIALDYGESDLAGSCLIDLSGERPEIQASFSSSRLDVRGVGVSAKNAETPEERQDTEKQTGGSGKRVFSPEPLDFGFLNALNLTFELTAQRVLFPRSAISDVHFKTVLKDGQLSVEPFYGVMGGGDFTTTLHVGDFSDGRKIDAFVRIENMDIARMFEEMELQIHGEGDVDFFLDLHCRGRSVAEFMASLDGYLTLSMGEGRINRNYLKYLGIFRINLISTMMNIIQIPAGQKRQDGASAINCFAMRFDAKDGKADLTALVLDRPNICIVGSGRIDLADESLDIYVNPIAKEGFGAEGLAKVNLSLSELTRAFRLGGTLANPRVSLNTEKTFFTIGKAIGGTVLFGPAGLAVALFSGTIGTHPENPCLDALAAAEKGIDIGENQNVGPLQSIQNFLMKLSPLH